MRKAYALKGLVLMLLLAVSGLSFIAGTKAFKSKEGKFSIVFKQAPKESAEDVQTDVGNIKMYMFLLEEGTTKAYMVAYCDYPKEMVEASDPNTILQGAKEGVLGQFEAVVTSEDDKQFMGNTCKNFTASGETYHTSYKMILVKNRLYQVGILSLDGPVAEHDTKDFIGSFKLTK